MDTLIANLALGFQVAGTLDNIGIALIGVLLGTMVGVLPGLGPTAAMSLLLPLTFVFQPVSAVILLAGIWYGSQYGGSTTSILLNMPGEATSVVTAFDGYKMAQKGRAGAALFIAATGSYVAGMLGLLGLAVAAPALSDIALAFGPPEYFAITVLGLVILFNVSGGSALKAALMAAFGMMVGTVGVDAVSGSGRFTFGVPMLLDGITVEAVIMGVYGLSELIQQLSRRLGSEPPIPKVKFKDLYPTRTELRRSVWPVLRGSVIGFFVGLVPGPGGVISTFLSYRTERKLSAHPEEFGEGAIEGVAGPEAANNAVTSASMIPLLSLGIPFSAPAAVLLTGFIVHGITPGPGLITNQPELFWGLVASMAIGNLALLVLNLPLVGVFAWMISLPKHYILPFVGLLLFAGAYAASLSMISLLTALISGILAWLLRPFGFDPAPFVLGLILGPLMERSVRQSLAIYDGSFWMIFTNPLAGGMLVLAVLFVLVATVVKLRDARLDHAEANG